jgi:hypothetical protein
VFLEALELVIPEALQHLVLNARAEELSGLRVIAMELGRADMMTAIERRTVQSQHVIPPQPVISPQPVENPEPLRAKGILSPAVHPAAHTPVVGETLSRSVPSRTQPREVRLPSGERSCEELCEFISSRFGSHLDESTGVDDQTRNALHELRGGFQRSIHRLAEELYAGSAHFVLELIQNADDNQYPIGAVPSLRITAAKDHLRFDNNEVGFSEANVRALCSIGQSTKHVSDPRYIGNKGVGWKSVFKVSPHPEVHSRHYHLRFDSTDASGLGYICPKPTAPLAAWDEVGGTSIVLPISAHSADADVRDFEVAMSKMQPLLLLFLHKLERIELTLTTGSTRSLKRCQSVKNVVTLEEHHHNHELVRKQFLVTKRQLLPPVKRGLESMASTELIIAVPLSEAPGERLPVLDV